MKNNKLVWVAQIVLCLGFLFFGLGKFLMPEQTAAWFTSLGGSTAQQFVGAYETISAMLVIVPATAVLGAVLIILSMISALILHLTLIGDDYLIAFNIIFIALSAYVIKHRRKDFLKRKSKNK